MQLIEGLDSAAIAQALGSEGELEVQHATALFGPSAPTSVVQILDALPEGCRRPLSSGASPETVEPPPPSSTPQRPRQGLVIFITTT